MNKIKITIVQVSKKKFHSYQRKVNISLYNYLLTNEWLLKYDKLFPYNFVLGAVE